MLVWLLSDGGPVAAQAPGAPQAPPSPTPASSGGTLQWPAAWVELPEYGALFAEIRNGRPHVAVHLLD